VSEATSAYHQAVETVITKAVSRLDDADLDLASLASEAGYSPFHFHRLFAALTGETPVAMVRRLRLERAAATLVRTKRSIGEAAMDAGYSTPDAFARAFRQAFGVLPSEFRQKGYNPRIQCPTQVHFDQPSVINFLVYGTLNMQTTIENRPSLNVIGMPHKGAYWTIGRTFGALAGWAASTGLEYTTAIAVYYDDPAKVPESELRSDAALVVTEPATPPEGMVAYTIPEGRYLVATHMGSYEGLGVAWSTMFGEELPKSGATLREGYCYEHYVNDCNKVPIEEVKTELLVPVA
jgi:AraC family transcriptional regulator